MINPVSVWYLAKPVLIGDTMRMVLVLPLKSFNEFTRDQPHWVWMDQRTAELIVIGYFKLLWDPAWEESCPSPE